MDRNKHKGFAKVEFLACKDEILSLQEAGYNLAMIYENLLNNKKITMSYRQFNRYMASKKPKLQDNAPQQAVKHFGVKIERPEKPSGAASAEGFVHDPSAKSVLDRLKPAGGKKED